MRVPRGPRPWSPGTGTRPRLAPGPRGARILLGPRTPCRSKGTAARWFSGKITSRRPLLVNFWPFCWVVKNRKNAIFDGYGSVFLATFTKIEKCDFHNFCDFRKITAKICDVRGPDSKNSFWARDFTLTARRAKSAEKFRVSPLAHSRERKFSRYYVAEISRVKLVAIANFCGRPQGKNFARAVIGVLASLRGARRVTIPGPFRGLGPGPPGQAWKIWCFPWGGEISKFKIKIWNFGKIFIKIFTENF